MEPCGDLQSPTELDGAVRSPAESHGPHGALPAQGPSESCGALGSLTDAPRSPTELNGALTCIFSLYDVVDSAWRKRVFFEAVARALRPLGAPAARPPLYLASLASMTPPKPHKPFKNSGGSF